jgi:hypothetical protein
LLTGHPKVFLAQVVHNIAIADGAAEIYPATS